jgi:hypothetical protein
MRFNVKNCFWIPCVLVIASCFSPYKPESDSSAIRIDLSGSGGGRAVSSAEAAALRYVFSFSGSGETLEKTIEPGSDLSFNFPIKPGNWDVMVRAYTTDEPPVFKGSGRTSVTVQAGETKEAEIVLKSLVWYVAAAGNDGNDGSLDSPLETVNKALALIADSYAGDWPDKGTSVPETAVIVITGTLAGSGSLAASNNSMADISRFGVYPPIELRGKSASETGTLDANGYGSNARPLYISGGNRVTLGPNLTLMRGAAGGVYVNSSAFTMKGGKITANTGNGVYVENGVFIMNGGTVGGEALAEGNSGGIRLLNSSFEMSGGKISYNQTSSGGGVYISGASVVFTMSGGEISNNSAYVNSTGSASVLGGGVYINATSTAVFTLSGGKISNNTAQKLGSTGSAHGGGVYFTCPSPGTSTFIMGNCEISGNIATANITSGSASAGGVYYNGPVGTFSILPGSKISNNSTAGEYGSATGGGLYLTAANVIMEGGEISGNTASYAGGVSVSGIFTMHGGVIANNKATYSTGQGGGVSFSGSGTFKKEPAPGSVTSGIIYGSDAAVGLKNTSTYANGQAVYVSTGPKYRNITAGESDHLDSTDAAGWGL